MITFVDIGARGGIKQHWRLIRHRLNVHAFEPNRDEWPNLKKMIYWEEATLYPDALWSEEKTLTLYVTKNAGLTSVYKPLPLNESMEVIRTDEVHAKTLDSFDLSPDLIKVDTQGAELEILKGGTESLKTCTCVEMEMEFEPQYEGQPLFNEINEFMLEQGYYLWRVAPVRSVGGRPFTDGIYFRVGSEGTDKRNLIEGVYRGIYS